MEEMIGYCGYNCHLCAARSDDEAVRQRLVDGWRRIFSLKMYTALIRILAETGRLPPWVVEQTERA